MELLIENVMKVAIESGVTPERALEIASQGRLLLPIARYRIY